MLQTSMRAQSRRRSDEALIGALDQLRHALEADVPGHEREWAEMVKDALAHLELALRQHMARAETPDGVFSEVDDTRPTLARQADELCGEHEELLKRVLALRDQVHQAGAAFQPAGGPTAKMDAVGIPDFGALREQALQLLAALRQHQEEENKLVLESVNTDIGVGD